MRSLRLLLCLALYHAANAVGWLIQLVPDEWIRFASALVRLDGWLSLASMRLSDRHGLGVWPRWEE